MIQNDLGEKCGIVGIFTPSKNASTFARQALAALQHRGQESAGIAVLNEKHRINLQKGKGLVSIALCDTALKKLGKSTLAIGHNRYSTSGSGSAQNAQPFLIKNKKYQLAIGHNGNIPDIANIKKQLKSTTTMNTDTFLVASLIAQERPKYTSWEETLQKILPQLNGAYNFVMLTNDGHMYGIRDPYGIRPFCLGKLPHGWILASESVSLDAVGATFVRDVKPGEIIMINSKGEISSSFFGAPKRAQHCLFEYIYFSRPDSFINGRRVRTGREKSGELLAERLIQKNVKPDVIIPTFDSGYPAAKGVSRRLAKPMVDAITTSHYIGRTFIQPGQDNRFAAALGKHNIVPDEILGKKVVVVDDSAVRLTTSKSLIQRLKDAGATAVYFGIASPPVVDQCDLGIDMRNKKFLPASKYAKQPIDTIEKNIAALIGADNVIYLPIKETTQAFGGTPKDFYHTPFGGPHPIKGKQEQFPKKEKATQKPAKICILISGNGTYVQDIIDGIADASIPAQITEIICNVPNAGGITRAKKYDIPVELIEYTGKKTDKQARIAYENKLIAHIKKNMPDMILLSGWQMILGDTFLQAMTKLQIPVFNHHPALLTSTNEKTVATSRGIIPVLRGAHVGDDALKMQLPVTGISMHQVIAGETVDVGPVVMKAEVQITKEDTAASVKTKMQATEHILVPTAIKYILHVLSSDIDTSKGDFPW